MPSSTFTAMPTHSKNRSPARPKSTSSTKLAPGIIRDILWCLPSVGLQMAARYLSGTTLLIGSTPRRLVSPWRGHCFDSMTTYVGVTTPVISASTFVAHSMGNWALRHAVQAIKGERRLQPIFDNVFLMAADEDEGRVRKRRQTQAAAGTSPSHVHVYHSEDDKALVISDTTKSNPDRLGQNGPRSFSGISARVIAVDCQDVDDTAFLHVNHQYYRRRDEVIKDVNEVLLGTRPDNIPGRVVIEPGRRYRIRSNGADPRLTTPAKPVSPVYVGHK